MVAAAPLAAAKTSNQYLVYFGTYTRKTSKGIYCAKLDATTGKVSEPELAGEMSNPSFVAIHPNLKNLYAVTEMGARGEGGTITSFSIDRASGKLTKINQVSSKGNGPCHLNVDRTGHTLAVANYGSGSCAALPVKSDGSLGESNSFIQHKGGSANKSRQEGPHAHSVNISPDNRFLIVADLGLDEVLVYKFNPATSTITPNEPPFVKVAPGSGPRHFTFHPKGKYAYVINELLSTVTAFKWDAKAGVLTEIQTVSTLPEDYKGNTTTAEVRAHPSGKFLYGSNRGHDSITVFQVDQAKGTLKRTGNVSTQGQVPRNFCIDPTGKWLLAANQNSENVVVFQIDQSTGDLKPTGQQLKIDSCVCVRYVAI